MYLLVELPKELSKAKSMRALALGIVLTVGNTIIPEASSATAGSAENLPAKSIDQVADLLYSSSHTLKAMLPPLAAFLHTTCATLDSFCCLSPLARSLWKSPFRECYEAVCVNWCEVRGEWDVAKSIERDDGIFGMIATA